MTDQNDIEKFIYDMRVVAGARFAMASRLEFSAHAKGFLINGATAASIFISAGLLIADSSRLSIEGIAVSLIGISIFTMWMNLDKSETDLINRAILSRENAVEINEIRKKLEHGRIEKGAALADYEKSLLSYKGNHTSIDRKYAIFKIKQKDKDPDGLNWINSVLPWIAILLWYPIVFSLWIVIVYFISMWIT